MKLYGWTDRQIPPVFFRALVPSGPSKNGGKDERREEGSEEGKAHWKTSDNISYMKSQTRLEN